MRVLYAILTGVLMLPLHGHATEAEDGVTEVAQCLEKNLPKKTSLQTVEFRARDRVGAERIIRARIYGKLFDDGFRRALIRFTRPADVNGSALLIIEKEGDNDLFLFSPDMGRTRRVTTHMAAGSLFGTDFSYEDFERLQGLANNTKNERRPDAVIGDTPVYVLATQPDPNAVSMYEEVVLYVDKRTCVPLKVESYEKGGRLRKVLEVDPGQITQEHGIWIPRELRIEDKRDQTETRLVIEEIEVDEEIPDRRFRLAELDRRRR